MPLVVTTKWFLKYSLGLHFLLGPRSRAYRLSSRGRRKGMHSPIWPMTILSFGNSSNTSDAINRIARVNVDGHVQGCRAFEDRPELPVVEILAIGMRVDDRALQPERAHGSLQL